MPRSGSAGASDARDIDWDAYERRSSKFWQPQRPSRRGACSSAFDRVDLAPAAGEADRRHGARRRDRDCPVRRKHVVQETGRHGPRLDIQPVPHFTRSANGAFVTERPIIGTTDQDLRDRAERGLPMSLLEQGLPAQFFTRRRAVLAGLGIAGAFIIGSSAYSKMHQYFSEPRRAPICYGDKLVAGRDPIPAFGSSDAKVIEERPAASTNASERLARAMQACSARSCSREDWKAYRSAIFWYLTPRLQHTSRLYQRYGDNGVSRAQRLYRNPLDREVERGLEERYSAGVFRINDFRQNREAVAMIVLGSAELLRPCGVNDPQG
jgi:hypothetical protein